MVKNNTKPMSRSNHFRKKDAGENYKDTARIILAHAITVPFSLTMIEENVSYMSKHGFDIHVISSSGPQLSEFSSRQNAIIHEVEMTRKISPVTDLISLLRLVHVLRKIRPDIIEAHTPKAGILGMLAARICNVPVRIYYIHGFPFLTANGFRYRLLLWTDKIACYFANQVLCVSHSNRAIAVQRSICEPAKIKVLLNGGSKGIDTDIEYHPSSERSSRSCIRNNYSIPRDAFVIGFVGRIVRDKGIPELLESWSCLRNEYPKLHMLIIGPFEERDHIAPEDEVILRRDERIHLTGFLNYTRPFYDAMDLFVLPTLREGLPSVLLEAAAMELPIVSTRVPGCVDAVEDNVTATLVPPEDPLSLTKAVRAYLDDEQLCVSHGKAGRELVKNNFQKKLVLQAVYAEYNRLLEVHGK